MGASYNKAHPNNGLTSKSLAESLKSSKLTTDTLLSVFLEKAATERCVEPPSSVIFVKELPLHDTSATVTLFSKPAYKVQVQIEISSNQLHPQKCLLDTGFGINIVSKTFLSKEWSTSF